MLGADHDKIYLGIRLCISLPEDEGGKLPALRKRPSIESREVQGSPDLLVVLYIQVVQLVMRDYGLSARTAVRLAGAIKVPS